MPIKDFFDFFYSDNDRQYNNKSVINDSTVYIYTQWPFKLQDYGWVEPSSSNFTLKSNVTQPIYNMLQDIKKSQN